MQILEDQVNTITKYTKTLRADSLGIGSATMNYYTKNGWCHMPSVHITPAIDKIRIPVWGDLHYARGFHYLLADYIYRLTLNIHRVC